MKKLIVCMLGITGLHYAFCQPLTIVDGGITYKINGSLIGQAEQGGYMQKTYAEFNKDSLFIYSVHEYGSSVRSVYQYRVFTQSLSKATYTETKLFIPEYKTYPYFQLNVFTNYMREDVTYIIPPSSKYEQSYIELVFGTEQEMIAFRDQLFAKLK